MNQMNRILIFIFFIFILVVILFFLFVGRQGTLPREISEDDPNVERAMLTILAQNESMVQCVKDNSCFETLHTCYKEFCKETKGKERSNCIFGCYNQALDKQERLIGES